MYDASACSAQAGPTDMRHPRAETRHHIRSVTVASGKEGSESEPSRPGSRERRWRTKQSSGQRGAPEKDTSPCPHASREKWSEKAQLPRYAMALRSRWLRCASSDHRELLRADNVSVLSSAASAVKSRGAQPPPSPPYVLVYTFETFVHHGRPVFLRA